MSPSKPKSSIEGRVGQSPEITILKRSGKRYVSTSGFDKNYDLNGFEPSPQEPPVRKRSFKTYDDTLGEKPPSAWVANKEQTNILKQANISIKEMEDSLESAGFWKLPQNDRHYFAQHWFSGVTERLRQSRISGHLSHKTAELNASSMYNCTMKDELNLFFAGFDCVFDKRT